MNFCEQLVFSGCVWFQQQDRASCLPSSQAINHSCFSRKGEKKGRIELSFEGSYSSALHWACPFHLFLDAVEGDFVISVAAVLILSFRARTKNCLCWKSRPGLCSTVVTSPASPNYCPPHDKVCQRAASCSYGCSTCLSPPPSLSGGKSEEGGEGRAGVGCKSLGWAERGCAGRDGCLAE